jgi:hypothetical protein
VEKLGPGLSYNVDADVEFREIDLRKGGIFGELFPEVGRSQRAANDSGCTIEVNNLDVR